MSTTYNIDVIAGDGIGQEVTPAAISCVDTVAANHDFTINWRYREWGSDHYRAHGTMMPTTGSIRWPPVTASCSAPWAPPTSPTTSPCGVC